MNRVLKWFVDLIDLEKHTASDRKATRALKNLSAALTFDYIELKVNSSLASCEELATAMITVQDY